MRARKSAYEELWKNNLYKASKYDELIDIIKSYNIPIIPYKTFNNKRDVEEIAKYLDVEKKIITKRSFYYDGEKGRYIFINDNENKEDKFILLTHEFGHLQDPRIRYSEAIHTEVQREKFANDFSLYMRHPSIIFKLLMYLKFNYRRCIGIAISMLIIFSFIVQPEINGREMFLDEGVSAEGNIEEWYTYFVVKGENCYHKEGCNQLNRKSEILSIREEQIDDFVPCSNCIK